MFFEKNKNLLIATGGVALLWIILYFVFVSPNWEKHKESEEAAKLKRKEWEDTAAALSEKKEAAKAKRTNEFLTRVKAEKELEENSKQTLVRMKDLEKIEFGTHETLKAFSLAAAGAGGDIQNLLNEKTKQAVQRAKIILPKEKVPDDLFVKSGDSSVQLSLLRLAMIDRFLSACKEVKDVATKECRIEQIVQVDYYAPVPIAIPVATDEKGKPKDDEDDTGEVKKPTKPKKGEKAEEKRETIDRLIQIPMKVLVRGPERYINQLLVELAQPTPAQQLGEDRRGYFAIRGFHVTTRETLPNSVEMCVAVSALIRESEIQKLKVAIKVDGRGGAEEKVPAPF